MNTSKYLLTYDLRVLYCPNIKLALSCKELNLDTLEFTYYEGDLSVLHSCYELDADNVEAIVKNIINGEIGNELDLNEMSWLKTFDIQCSQNKSLLNNNKLVFNYLILKLKLLGFSEEESKNIVKTYFTHLKNGIDLPDVETFIYCINRKISNKKFWICRDLFEESELEYKFIKTILSYKTKLNHKFDFSVFKEDYLNVCEKSIVPKLYTFNQTPSYLVRKPLDISDQRPYLLYTYKNQIASIIKYLVNRDFKQLIDDERFINILIDDLATVLKLYLSIRETEDYNN